MVKTTVRLRNGFTSTIIYEKTIIFGFYLILLLAIWFDVQVGRQFGGKVGGCLTFSDEDGREKFYCFRIGESLYWSDLRFFRLFRHFFNRKYL